MDAIFGFRFLPRDAHANSKNPGLVDLVQAGGLLVPQPRLLHDLFFGQPSRLFGVMPPLWAEVEAGDIG